MSLVLRVGESKTTVAEIPASITTYRSAFASYASEDRAEVLSRVQGMVAVNKNMDVFVDAINIRAGQDWEESLLKHLLKAAVFYLFWCRHAISPDWVTKEWHLALETKGEDFIDPVPLENPEVAPPPRQLSRKHFNDPLLAFIAISGGGHS